VFLWSNWMPSCSICRAVPQVVFPDGASGGATDAPEQIGVIMTVTALHSRIGIPLVGGTARASAKESLTRSLSGRARASRYSSRRFAAAGHAENNHDQARLRASRQSVGNDLGAVANIANKQDATRGGYDS